MKTKILLIILLILPIIGFGQELSKKNLPEVKVTPPAFTGIENYDDMIDTRHEDPIINYLSENFHYPWQATQYFNEGTATVEFLVKSNGELTDFRVINSVSREIDQEFIRILRNTEGMWKPGLNNDKPVDMEKEVSMMFVSISTGFSNPVKYFNKKATDYFVTGSTLFLTEGKTKKALRAFNNGVRYMPNDASLLILRGMCKYELGDEEGAYSDWERINKIGKDYTYLSMEGLREREGYAEMLAVLEH